MADDGNENYTRSAQPTPITATINPCFYRSDTSILTLCEDGKFEIKWNTGIIDMGDYCAQAIGYWGTFERTSSAEGAQIILNFTHFTSNSRDFAMDDYASELKLTPSPFEHSRVVLSVNGNQLNMIEGIDPLDQSTTATWNKRQ